LSLGYALLSPVLAALCSHWSRAPHPGHGAVHLQHRQRDHRTGTQLPPGAGLPPGGRRDVHPQRRRHRRRPGRRQPPRPSHRDRYRRPDTSLAFGAPLGTAIGDAFGWQAALWFVTALAAVVAPVIAWRLPTIHLGITVGLRQRLAP